ncbi:MAG: hypothetical protein FWD90_06055, partial [Defluviitaleaceae bacterium]|nr:hypothetical protein [Defluviitaleaceae bacterium]
TSGAGAGGCSISSAYAIGRLTANGRVTWLASGACNRCNHFADGAVHRPIALSAALEHPPAPAPRNKTRLLQPLFCNHYRLSFNK